MHKCEYYKKPLCAKVQKYFQGQSAKLNPYVVPSIVYSSYSLQHETVFKNWEASIAMF